MRKLHVSLVAAIALLGPISHEGAIASPVAVAGAAGRAGGVPFTVAMAATIDVIISDGAASGTATFVAGSASVTPHVGRKAILTIDCATVVENEGSPDEFVASGTNLIPWGWLSDPTEIGDRFTIGGTIEVSPLIGIQPEGSEGPCGSEGVDYEWRLTRGAFLRV